MLCDSNEEWKPVVGFEEYLLVSSFGRVRRIRTKKGTPVDRLLNPFMNANGYLSIDIQSKPVKVRKYIHIAVAAAFHGPCPVGHEVNHLDRVTYNNAASNLQYVTHLDNMRHAHRTGLIAGRRGCKSEWKKTRPTPGHQGKNLPADMIKEIVELSYAESASQIAKRLHISVASVKKYRKMYLSNDMADHWTAFQRHIEALGYVLRDRETRAFQHLHTSGIPPTYARVITGLMGSLLTHKK